MADIDDLDYKSILELGDDEAIEMLRQIRLSRRTSVKKATRTSQKKQAVVVDANLADKLLEILEGKTKGEV